MDSENFDLLQNEPVLPISAAARMVGISSSALRMYEAEGLLIPYKTTKNMRLFSRRDLEWVKHIRKLIKKEKLSVEGIRRILALIPCWKIRNCAPESLAQCKAYRSNSAPCWTIQDRHGECQYIECRLCDVYRGAFQAFNTKKMLRKYTDYLPQ